MFPDFTHVVNQHVPVRRACSLLGECIIEAGPSHDYAGMCIWHYRDTKNSMPGFHALYRAVHVPTKTMVGVIVYTAAALNLGIRNQIFSERYKIGGGSGTNQIRAQRLNRELELIFRVVIHPTFRGIGLGVRLIRETLEQRPYQFVEMTAAMGAINPFAEKAGMLSFPVPRPKNTERVFAAMRSVGISEEKMSNPAETLRAMEKLSPAAREFVDRELIRYATRWIKSRTSRTVGNAVRVTVEDAVRRLAHNGLLESRYFLWENPRMTGVIDLAASSLAGQLGAGEVGNVFY